MKVIRILLSLVTLSALGVAATSLAYPFIWGGYALLVFYLGLPQMFLLLIASISLRRTGNRAAVGYWARRALYVTLGVFSLSVDFLLRSTASSFPARPPLIALPMFAGAALTIAVAVAIRVIELGRLRYIVPLISSAPLVVMAIADGMFRWYWIGLSGPLLVYAGCMVYLQSVGIGVRAREPL